jgi:hypothetical protein
MMGISIQGKYKGKCGVYAKNLTAQIQKKTENNEKP